SFSCRFLLSRPVTLDVDRCGPGWCLELYGWSRRARPAHSPGGLGDAGQLAAVRHLPQAHPAQAELAEDRLGATALLAPRVGAHAELGLAALLDLQSCLGHLLLLSSAAGRASRDASAAPGPRRRWWPR